MRRILLVEDNEANRDVIRRYLQMFDCQISVACNGREGVERAKELHEEIDLILMDMSLPEIDGWEATRQIKADASTRHLPVIALTAHAMVGDREQALAAGCDDFATKPVDFPELLAKIEKLSSKADLP